MAESGKVKLLPCPFCGEEDPDIEYSDSSDSPDVWVQCVGCETQGPVTRIGCRDDEGDGFDLEAEAAELWNKRATPLRLVKDEGPLQCSECGELTCEREGAGEDDPVVYGCSKCGALSCDNCGSGGLCSSCDVDAMAGVDDDE